jgi:hypothetical protein
MFALHQSLKVLVKLFQKLASLGSAHKNGAFFLPSFFFAPRVSKKKRHCGLLQNNKNPCGAKISSS